MPDKCISLSIPRLSGTINIAEICHCIRHLRENRIEPNTRILSKQLNALSLITKFKKL